MSVIDELILTLLEGWGWHKEEIRPEDNYKVSAPKRLVKIENPGIIWNGAIAFNDPDAIVHFIYERPEIKKESIEFRVTPRTLWEYFKNTTWENQFPYTTSPPTDADWFNVKFVPALRIPVRRCEIWVEPPTPGKEIIVRSFVFSYLEIYDKEKFINSLASIYRRIYGIDEILEKLDKLTNSIEKLTEKIESISEVREMKQIVFDPLGGR